MLTQIFAVWPTRTEPKRTRDGTEMNLVTGRRPAPDSVTVTLVPLSPVTVSELVAGPGRAGVNRTWTGIAAPGLMTVPGVGRPAAVYGPVGALTEVTRTGMSPPLTMLVVAQALIPTGTFVITPSLVFRTSERLVEVANSPVLVPSPARGTETGPALVANETEPEAPPTAPGANLTCARSASPLCRVTGNFTPAVAAPPWWVTVTRLIVNGPGRASARIEAPVTVTVLVAVTVTGRVVAECTVVSGKVTVRLRFSAPPLVMPNPYTRPSLVPT